MNPRTIGCLFVSLVGFAVLPAFAQKPQPQTLSFNGGDYFHRWSKSGQHEFTPQGEEDLSKWTSMMTVNVYEPVRTGDQLADVANRVLATYQQHGKIIRTDSKPRTGDAEAEHLIVAVLGEPAFLEAVFARFVLRESRGMAVIYSKRIYAEKAGNEMSAWLERNGPGIERALMAWTAVPSLAMLKGLPESSQ